MLLAVLSVPSQSWNALFPPIFVSDTQLNKLFLFHNQFELQNGGYPFEFEFFFLNLIKNSKIQKSYKFKSLHFLIGLPDLFIETSFLKENNMV